MTIPAETVARASACSIVETAIMLGAARKHVGTSERGGPCPGCGGKNRFSVDHGKNVFSCRFSGAGGDAIDLVRHCRDASFVEAVEMLTGERAVPAAPAREENEDKSAAWREKARERAWKIWREANPAGRLVRRYLEARGIPFPTWRLVAVREHVDLPYWHWSESHREFRVIHRGPAMVAAITGPASADYPTGRFMGVHRTWIGRDGKAEIADPETGELVDAKKVEGSQKGGRVVLRNAARPLERSSTEAGGDHGLAYAAPFSMAGEAPAAPVLATGEGIETVLSWDVLHPEHDGAELWSGLNIGNIAGRALESVPHPALTRTDTLGRVRRVKVPGPDFDPADTDCLAIAPGQFSRAILLGDGDSDAFTTTAAMTRATRRLATEAMPVDVDWAPPGMDWNNVLTASRGGSEAPPPAPPAGRATTRDGRSALRPAADGDREVAA